MSRVMLLHTGGTLGMHRSPLEPGNYASTIIDKFPEIAEIAELESRIICNLDSSDLNPTHWQKLAQEISQNRDSFDGFVIIHGTDTMPYTASALSFALRGLDCPVILTGAQRPLGYSRSDARRNLADAIELATCDIPEVCICFDGLLLRGCRAVKSHAQDYRAFDSPGCPPLARLGVNIELASHIRRPQHPFILDDRFDPNVLALPITPGLSPALLDSIINSDHAPRGVILIVFGLGTIPSEILPLGPPIKEAIQRGVEILIITQSAGKIELGSYQNSKPLEDAGVIPGGHMRLEAALPKLMHALAAFPERAARRRFLEWNVAGEIA